MATTTAGTTMADFADRSLGVGYVGGSLILFALVMAALAVWWFTEGSVSVNNITSPRVETFYWVTILFSNTLGATMGDILTKPHAAGGLDFSRISSSAIIAVVIIAMILIVPQKAGSHSST